MNQDDWASEDPPGPSPVRAVLRFKAQKVKGASPAGTAACSSSNPHFNYPAPICSDFPEEIPHLSYLKVCSEDSRKLAQPPGKQAV